MKRRRHQKRVTGVTGVTGRPTAGFWCERKPPTPDGLRADMLAAHARGETWQTVAADPPFDPCQPGVRGTIVGPALLIVAPPSGPPSFVMVFRAIWRGPRHTVTADAYTIAEAVEALAAERERWGCADDEPERYPGEPRPTVKH